MQHESCDGTAVLSSDVAVATSQIAYVVALGASARCACDVSEYKMARTARFFEFAAFFCSSCRTALHPEFDKLSQLDWRN